MLIAYRAPQDFARDMEMRLERSVVPVDGSVPEGTLWLDLVSPTAVEDKLVEQHLGIEIPTREDMEDIEPSELLYVEHGARYMTARLLFNVANEPQMAGVTFIVKDNALVTVRYDEPKAFAMFANRASRPGGCGPTADAIVVGLLETVIDRAAEVLQATADRIDRVSQDIFEKAPGLVRKRGDYYDTLQALGRYGTLISMSRESLVSIERVLLFLSASYRTAKVPKELREQVRTTLRDLQSLEEHATFQSNKIQFLLDASLGLVNLEQNNIIKLFSVVAVIFMPPTLVASIYGMNFQIMPELHWEFGYPLAIGFMIAAAVAPYLFFRWKRWL
ncbi:Magnesium transport protein CorA [Hyphomicrobiales bacterium]|nr:Magnesium transport protein CorA [Hyphomicrobiales bacterium]CAH1670993.1 Magnesium transport protein CorA [Hyphomicrobiales bacterium]